jgi:tripartite-type tricarboxylate transporter receptor subunit TctC
MLAAAAGALLSVAGTGFAQTALPGSGTIRIIVPFTPGTTPDVIARLMGPTISTKLGRPVIVENKPGASGILGMDTVAKAAPDGTTIMVNTNTSVAIPYFYKKVPFDVIQSFQPISMVGHTNYVLVGHPSVPAANGKELIAYLKKNPGKLNYASPGNGTFHHLVMEQFKYMTGTDVPHIPYKGSAGVFTDLVGGHVSLTVMPLHVAAPLEASGKVKIFGATRAERDRSFPKVPTLQEAGIPQFNADGWFAVWGPKGMSNDVVTAINSAVRDALATQDIKTKLDQQGISIQPGSPDELLKTARAEYEQWGRVIKAANIQPE